MANSTVYPYGTGGSLPSSIGLINDLRTGGVNKALTAQQGVEIREMIETGDFEFSPDIDKVGQGFSKTGATYASSSYGIKTIPVKQGDSLKIWGGPLLVGSDYSAICFSEDGESWTPLWYGTSLQERYYWFKAPADGLVGICLAKDEAVKVNFEDDVEPEANSKKLTISPSSRCLLTIGSGSAFTAIKNFIWAESETYKGAQIFIADFGGNNTIYFQLTNQSYSPVRMIGLKGGIIVKTTTTSGDMVVTDNILGKMLKVDAAFQSGIDTVYWTFQENSGYEASEYESFGIVNTYCQEQKFSNIAQEAYTFFYEDYFPVGTLVKYRSGKLYKVVKDKPANSYPSSGGVVETTLVKTRLIPIASSMAALVDVMNKMSYNIGAVSSDWKNPYGGSKYAVDNNLNRTTAKDMCRIMAYVYRYCPKLLAVMSTETAKVHIYGANDRDKTLKNNTREKLAAAYTSLHGSGATMPYSIIANKPGATVSTTTAGDGVSNTGFSIVALAKIGDKLVVADAAYLSSTDYTTGRTNRAKAMIQLLDIAKAIIDGGSAEGMATSFIERGAAAIVNPDGLEFIYDKNGDDLFQPASTSKVMGAVAILSVIPNLEEYHSIWNNADELMNDSGSDESSSETHIAKAGDVESVSTSLYAMMLVSNGANTMSLARMAGEKIIRSKEQFLDI